MQRHPDAGELGSSCRWQTGVFVSHADSNLSVLVEREEADRRLSPRRVIQVLARVRVEGDPPLDAQTVDLSHHGVSITSPRQLNVGQECIVELGVSVPEIASPPALRAGVRYCTRLRDGEFRIGLKFTSVSIEAAELIVAVLG
jgi:PilZ domain